MRPARYFSIIQLSNARIRHGNAFFPENTAGKTGGSLSSGGKRKKKEPEDSRGILYYLVFDSL